MSCIFALGARLQGRATYATVNPGNNKVNSNSSIWRWAKVVLRVREKPAE
jgi:hypothetical protein